MTPEEQKKADDRKKEAALLALLLFNYTVRRQIYLEGVKRYYALQFVDVSKRLTKIIEDELGKLSRGIRLGDLSRAEFLSFSGRVRRKLDGELIKWTQGFTLTLRDFLSIDVDIAHQIYGVKNSDLDKKSAHDTEAGNSVLWASVLNAFVPAAGAPLAVMLSSFIAAAIDRYAKGLVTGYSDYAASSDIAQVMDTISTTVANGARGTISTAFQHVGSMAQAAVASDVYGSYVWTSVLDDRTTVICRGRNGNVYEYGRGPIPPAHYGCRSTTVPVVEGIAHPKQSYYAWLKSQPDDVQDDILGRKRGRDLRSGELKADDLDRFDGAYEITLEQYSGKAGFILRKQESQ